MLNWGKNKNMYTEHLEVAFNQYFYPLEFLGYIAPAIDHSTAYILKHQYTEPNVGTLKLLY